MIFLCKEVDLEKEETYVRSLAEIKSVLELENDLVASMTTICAILRANFGFFWVGFYRVVPGEELLIGPYQGTLGCLHIPFGKGVCGVAARARRTLIVPNVHEFPGHIACDPNSKSEIVVPVFDRSGELMAVLDIDSDSYGSFDEIDRRYLEEIATVLSDKS